ncbi:MAG: hypothetical protein EPO08_20600 [Rhodospirillaceae bacterium]|nr:MAG: hypothetical protein EPO08_20600 [Rhodospirillaceae bacterium]
MPWFDEPLRAWSKAIGIPAKDMRDLLPVIRSAGKPELADAARGPESWPDEFAARRARVVGASDLVPVVVGTLAPQGGAVVGLTAELGAGGGRIVLRTRNGKKLEPWVYGVWSTRLASGDSNGTPDWRWVRGNGPALLKAVEQRPIATQAQQLLRGTWDAVMEYDASAGRVPVRVTLRRKVSGYATLFIQGPAAGSDWRFGWERGRAATKWWVTVNWEGEGEADSMEAAIREGLRRLLSEVISPSCSKRDTEKPH